MDARIQQLLLNTGSQVQSLRVLGAILLAISLFTVSGCNRDNPGKWPVEKVSEQMQSSLNLSEIDLQPAEGGYEGTGTTAEGEKFKIIVKLEPGNSRYAYHAESDRGAFEDGYYEKK